MILKTRKDNQIEYNSDFINVLFKQIKAYKKIGGQNE